MSVCVRARAILHSLEKKGTSLQSAHSKFYKNIRQLRQKNINAKKYKIKNGMATRLSSALSHFHQLPRVEDWRGGGLWGCMGATCAANNVT